jgi:hypothetical protein
MPPLWQYFSSLGPRREDERELATASCGMSAGGDRCLDFTGSMLCRWLNDVLTLELVDELHMGLGEHARRRTDPAPSTSRLSPRAGSPVRRCRSTGDSGVS